MGELIGINDVIRDTNKVITSKDVLDATLSPGVYKTENVDGGLPEMSFKLLLVLKSREYISQVFYSPNKEEAYFRGYYTATKIWTKLAKFSTNVVE